MQVQCNLLVLYYPAVCRYQMQGGESLDVTFSNIRHAFFQESDNELITLVHFTLKDPIMAGKKKVTDVQFYTEVMENNTCLLYTSPSPRD